MNYTKMNNNKNKINTTTKMSFRFQTELLEISNENDISKRYDLALNLLTKISLRANIRENNKTEPEFREKIVKEDEARSIKSIYDFHFGGRCGLIYVTYSEEFNGRVIHNKKDINEVFIEDTDIDLYNTSNLQEVLKYLILIREQDTRTKIYNSLNKIVALKKSRYKVFNDVRIHI